MSKTPITDANEMRRLTTGHINGQVFQTEELVVASTVARDLECKLNRARDENSTLRTVMAKARIPCVYCGLEDMSKCQSGFPGCAKADDIIVGEEECFRAVVDERNTMKERMSKLESLILEYAYACYDGGENLSYSRKEELHEKAEALLGRKF